MGRKCIFWSEIGSRFGKLGRIARSNPLGKPPSIWLSNARTVGSHLGQIPHLTPVKCPGYTAEDGGDWLVHKHKLSLGCRFFLDWFTSHSFHQWPRTPSYTWTVERCWTGVSKSGWWQWLCQNTVHAYNTTLQHGNTHRISHSSTASQISAWQVQGKLTWWYFTKIFNNIRLILQQCECRKQICLSVILAAMFLSVTS